MNSKKVKQIKHFAALPEEVLLDEVVARVWDFKSPMPIFLGITVLGIMIDAFGDWFILPAVLGIVYLTIFSTYLIRQRWRLSLTDKQIVARQLFPRPFTFFTRDYHFPLNQIEGLTTGPRTFRSILLVGVYLTTNLGINLLIYYLSGGTDFPVALDGILEFLIGISFFKSFGLFLQKTLIEFFDFGVSAIALSLGLTFTFIGILLVIITIPRRDHIQIRVRHGADFKLNAGIPKSFWYHCYKEIYKEKLTESPPKYKKWKIQWFKDEEVISSADLEQTVHIDRFIGLLAMYIGIRRLVEQVEEGFEWNNGTLMTWAILTFLDIIIAAAAINYAVKKNEMVITNKRIIFGKEEKDISGVFGRRLYTLSDIKRDDVAGFNFHKIKAFSISYLFLSVLTITLLVMFWGNFSILVRILIAILCIFTLAFVNQTYVQFDLLTKGGEKWMMRHQLSNPMTIVRELMGGEDSRILMAIFSNRLEESEIIDTVQTIRSNDLNKDVMDRSNGITNRVKLELKDLLLKGEEVVFETNVSRNVPRRILTLSFASFIAFAFVTPGIASIVGVFGEEDIFTNYEFAFGILFVISATGALIIVITLWAKYFSLFKASLIVTKERLFFQDRKNPPLLLYLMGIHHETILHESLRNQIHSTYTNRQFSQKEAMRSFFVHTWWWLITSSAFGILLAMTLALHELKDYQGALPFDVTGYEPIFVSIISICFIIITFLSLKMAWHASNAFVELIRGWPRRIFNAKGVGVHHQVPFLKSLKAKQVNYSIWSGEKLEVKKS